MTASAQALASGNSSLPVLSMQEIMDLPRMNLSPLQITLVLARPEMQHFAHTLASSDMVPKAYINKPGNVLVAMGVAFRFGMDPLSVMEGLAVINGQPSFYGDLLLAVCMAHPDFEDIDETHTGEGDNLEAKCVVKRRGKQPKIGTFSVREAKKAKLYDKQYSPWPFYEKRMTQMRARAFALRDQFADILKGIGFMEEQADVQMTNSVLQSQSRGKVSSLTARLAQRASAVNGRGENAVFTVEGEIVDETTDDAAQGEAGDATAAPQEPAAAVAAAGDGGSNPTLFAASDNSDEHVTAEQLEVLRGFVRRRVNTASGPQIVGVMSSAKILELARAEVDTSIESIDALTTEQADDLIGLLQALADQQRD